MEIAEYKLVRSDHLFNVKCGEVCIYSKNYLPLRIVKKKVWKKGNLVSILKKGDKEWGKFLKGEMFDEMFPLFIQNNLIASNQSGFKPGESCINQLWLITHEIWKSFDSGYEVRGVFLDMSKAFDETWHKGISTS